MRLVYVIDCACGCQQCYVLRCPEVLARVICRLTRSRPLDYAPTPAGL